MRAARAHLWVSKSQYVVARMRLAWCVLCVIGVVTGAATPGASAGEGAGLAGNRHRRAPGLFGDFGDKVGSTITKLPQSIGSQFGDTANQFHQTVGQGFDAVKSKIPLVDTVTPFTDARFDKLFASSDEMVKSFQKQKAKSNSLLPLPAILTDAIPIAGMIPQFGFPSQSQAPQSSGPAPPRPTFDRSMNLHVDLVVPLAGYTEAYEIEWHAESNTMFKKMEGGTTIYRTPQPDGRVQFLEIRKDSEESKAKCVRSLVPIASGDKSFPGLPDLSQYNFVGNATMEVWRRVVEGKPGEGGAVKGEVQTVTHEMMVSREGNTVVPVRYSVVTDSSILGPSSDVYIQNYKVLPAPTNPIKPDTSKCEKIEDADVSKRQKRQGLLSGVTDLVSKFNPLQDFSLPFGGQDIGAVFNDYKDQFKRNYLDPAEEAVRKNLLTQSSRFIDAGNRASSSFTMGINFLADRLEDEIQQLFGIREPEGLIEKGLLNFPYSEKAVKDLSNKLPDEFDWRPLGAVSPVRYQGTTCASCWAFAVAGSTEGALFKKTNKLVPLSPQNLVDCGKEYGANGCNPTWPSFAYDYVQNRGLSAWDEYTDYEAKVLECKATDIPPVTHIGGHVNVTANNVEALKVAIKNHAPTLVIVDAMAKSFIYYKSGVLNDKRCGQSKPRLNHAVLAVGWSKKNGTHFILKNSWTDKWGDEGYIRVAPEACNVLERPTYSLIQSPHIDREALRSAASKD